MRHPPFARGVTHLMYVGDVPTHGLSTAELAIGAAGVYAAVTQKRTIRIAGFCAASWVAYRLLKSRGVV